MLSYNFFLLRKSPLKQFKKRNLWMISSIVYLDMYDLALYVGYAIYLSPVLFPGLKLYQASLLCSIILLLSQIAKVVGFVKFNLLRRVDRKVSTDNLFVIAACYAGIFITITGTFPVKLGLIFFILLRILQGFAIGREIGMVINYSSTTLESKQHSTLYYFILLSGEVGAVVSIFFNRLMVTHDLRAVTNDWAWHFQVLTGFLFSLLMFVVRIYLPPVSSKLYGFSSWVFIAAVRKDWLNIFLRSTIVLLQVLLIFIVIFRVPNILHLGMGWEITTVNHLVLFMTGFAFVGANTVTLLTRFLSPYRVIRSFFLVSICIAILWLFFGNNNDHFMYTVTLFTLAYIYGVFVRATPLYLYHLRDFKRRLMLISRYLSYIFSYTVLGPLAVVIMDTSHFLNRAFNDNGPPLVVLLASLAGLVALIFYTRHITSRVVKRLN